MSDRITPVDAATDEPIVTLRDGHVPAEQDTPMASFRTLQPVTTEFVEAQIDRIGLTSTRSDGDLRLVHNSAEVTVRIIDGDLLELSAAARVRFAPRCLGTLLAICNEWNYGSYLLRASAGLEEIADGPAVATVRGDHAMMVSCGAAPVQVQHLLNTFLAGAEELIGMVHRYDSLLVVA